MLEIDETAADGTLDTEILALIGDHILELDEDFGAGGNLFEAGLDSMAIMQLLLVLEEHLGIAIKVAEVTKDNFQSAHSIAALVRNKRGNEAGTAHHPPAAKAASGESKGKAAAFSEFTYPEAGPLHPFTESDCFVRANERVMVKTGQGLHIVASVIDLETAPDVARLQAAMSILMKRHPMLAADASQTFFGIPDFERGAGPATAVPLDFWHEEGAPGISKQWGSQPVVSAHDRLESLTNLTEAELQSAGRCHVRCDLIEKRDGDGFLFVLTWRHIVFDGVGAEVFCREIDHTAMERPGMVAAALEPAEDPKQALTLKQRFTKARPIINFLNGMSSQRFRSLGGPKPSAARLKFEVTELSAEQSARVFKRGEQFCGPVMTTPFHAACAIRAHEMVWRSRGETDIRYMVTVPIQMRRKGAQGPIFQNHLTMLFLTAGAEEASSLEKLIPSLQAQQESFLKDKLGESFREMQRLMRHMPPFLYTRFIRWHMRGEMTSFFFSGTGTFASEMETFAGARIRNAFHVPSINRPPGTGLFVNDKNGIVTAVMSYRENVITRDEALLLRDAFVEGLTGAWPHDSTVELRRSVPGMDDA